MATMLKCPKCQSTNVECDGRWHRCLDCNYDGRLVRPPRAEKRQAVLDPKHSGRDPYAGI